MKPILFNTEMVKAILDGQKTVTRRVIKGYILNNAHWGYTAFTPIDHISCRGDNGEEYGEKFYKLPYTVGDILYVRETFCHGQVVCGEESDGSSVFYVADGNKIIYKEWCERENIGTDDVIWHPSIHMPKEAARIFLKVTNVSVERLQEITEDDAKQKGCIDNRGFIYSPDNSYIVVHSAREHFSKVWDSTISKKDINRYIWDVNPWVWVIKFEQIKL